MKATEEFFAPGGPLARAHPGYEHRPGQQEMARAVTRVIRDGDVLMVEAGTGTGKTLAYLVPAIRSGRRVIVSTGTRNLQDQIFAHDLPLLRERLGWKFTAALMKGRDNYLCRYRLAEFARQPLLEVREEHAWVPKIRRWARTTRTGDRAEIADLPDRLRLWRDINARADTCTGSRCPEYEECWLTRMKRRAEQSQIVVVNHHLFFADLAVRSAYGAVLPDYDTVIFDEAHLLEEIATLYFGVQATSGQVAEVAREAEALAARTDGPEKGGGGAAALREAAAEFFLAIRESLREEVGRVRFEPSDRGGPRLDEERNALVAAIEEVARVAGASAEEGESGTALKRRAEELAAAITTIEARSDPDFVYGVEVRGRGGVILSASPIDVSVPLRENLFERLHACVLTSATLAVEGKFDFFQSRLGLDDAETLIVESSFDHREQAVLCLPRGMPEPRHPRFVERAAGVIRELLEITTGRAFLLFTSYANLEAVRALLEADAAWTLLVQGEGSKVALVERFRTMERAVLLGTTSFWHGVDVPGEALSLVVVDKLPFDVPSDPLIAARIEKIRASGGNPFEEYQTPLAVLELKQGLGRLLRSRRDRGILAVLDPRLTTRRYGRRFLASLPPHPVVRDLRQCREFFERGTEGAAQKPY